ncbi:HdeA/HdeB family chaperone [uncultured Sulfitobacter sp.]|uniref:HdeA/HdeB family chaperone n=1 Tax=uncultured Sulfitobacter sp. TaxID=191468 RepID=UPI0026115DFA|nr:HdeA/HdeB family chaperone [uncultured Sulfitobacter sp.]
MTRFIKTTAIAALALSTSLPAMAATSSDLNSMTCGEYNDLSQADQNRVAVAAVLELNNTSDATIADNNGVATATAPLVGEAAEESPSGSTTTIADSNGTATATTTVPAGDDMARYAEEIKVLNLTCARNIDAMVLEAAAGMDGTR